MDHKNEIKEVIKKRYSKIVSQSRTSSCCSAAKTKSSCCGSDDKFDVNMIGDEYKNINGHIDEADLSLGCGIPTKYAAISKGDSVVDLGSGAGNDVFVARQIVGDSGFVTGIDMTEEMINKANGIKQKLGYVNVEFKLGEIEAMPLPDNFADVVISNCVLNLVPDKVKSFEEIFRILKPGGHFCISDVVTEGAMPKGFKKSAELYAGCIAGAVELKTYLGIITQVGLHNIEVKIKKQIHIPEEVITEYLTDTDKKELSDKNFGLYSITVTGYKK